jgi:hypothetical protein
MSINKLLPWLLGICLLGFVVLVIIGGCQALAGSGLFARATPTPRFLAGTEVTLAGQDGRPVTVWAFGGDCETGYALGELPAGWDARILDDACYDRESRTLYQRIVLADGSTGWVVAADAVLATEYTPPPPTATLEPTLTPWPTATPLPTPTPTPAPLPVGSSLSAGNWGLRVDRVEIVGSLASPSGDARIDAAGRFALVFLTATNQGSDPETLHASSLQIEDAAGNRYGNHDLASAYASSAECLDFALTVAPEGSVCLVAAIDVSEQSDFYVLRVTGAKDTVLLDLP